MDAYFIGMIQSVRYKTRLTHFDERIIEICFQNSG